MYTLYISSELYNCASWNASGVRANPDDQRCYRDLRLMPGYLYLTNPRTLAQGTETLVISPAHARGKVGASEREFALASYCRATPDPPPICKCAFQPETALVDPRGRPGVQSRSSLGPRRLRPSGHPILKKQRTFLFWFERCAAQPRELIAPPRSTRECSYSPRPLRQVQRRTIGPLRGIDNLSELEMTL